MITMMTTAAIYHPVLLPFLSEANLDIVSTIHNNAGKNLLKEKILGLGYKVV
jgi:hypothetical protein